MKLRYVSDIHLEFMNTKQVEHVLQQFISDSNEVLILAGDIGNPFHPYYEHFMNHINQTFRKTFVIAGNHEYYSHGRTVAETKAHMHALFEKLPNISFLDNSCELFEGIWFIGTTLWSHIHNPAIQINDTKRIRGMTALAYEQEHAICLYFLETALTELTTDSTVVITHHMPSYDLIAPQYRGGSMEPYNQWFATDLNEMIELNQSRIKCWIYGHTHTPSEQIISGVPMLCNPIGYPGEQETVNYNKQFLLE